ncbi:hypothetical protein [[Mycobacterium] crassicus]|uniref:HNH endonuclease n=1 Tax=[Mycobacterium] crassicus TaxID=2872309 RepID=A0ABU5XG85_9MYCO|nr:hypothetical protein [Mycolicibacter sp. MYC098]MEB3021290.1 hypothetical protein [Mycolicibacter sp. MYC098]
MPDRYGNPDDDRDDPATARARAAELAQAARDRELEQRHAELELQAQARAACTSCDDDGYRNGHVCNHNPAQDAINDRGMAACRAALTKDDSR